MCRFICISLLNVFAVYLLGIYMETAAYNMNYDNS